MSNHTHTAASSSNHLPSPDEVSAAAALELQIHDIQQLDEQNKGKNRVDEPTDGDLARDMYLAELRNRAVFLADRLTAVNIGSTAPAAPNLLNPPHGQETSAAANNQLATRPDAPAGSAPSRDPGVQQSDEEGPAQDGLIERLLRYFCGSGQETEAATQAGPSGLQSQDDDDEEDVEHEDPIRTVACVACDEVKSPIDILILSLSCEHDYCGGCLRALFTACLIDESLYPRCCREPIPLDSVRGLIPDDLAASFQRRQAELTTTDRTYCSSPTCSTFIPQDLIQGDRASWPDCSAVTCAICKFAVHPGDCPQDSALHELQSAAQANGWRRCFSCRRFVELDVGCNHMTYVSLSPGFPFLPILPSFLHSSLSTNLTPHSCLCKAEFCYACGARWKTCTCPQWHEDRLYHRAGQIADREANRNAYARYLAQREPPRAVRVEAAARRLPENNNCRHSRWRYIEGSNDCDLCHETLRDFIFSCRACNLNACGRCRRNRL
jgi:hypothetical protein